MAINVYTQYTTPGSELEFGSVSGFYINLVPFVGMTGATGGGSSVWGGITGTLSAQTDLQTALNLKAALAGPQTHTGVHTFDYRVVIGDAYTNPSLTVLAAEDDEIYILRGEQVDDPTHAVNIVYGTAPAHVLRFEVEGSGVGAAFQLSANGVETLAGIPFVGDLTGTASKVALADTTDTTCFVMLAESATGNQAVKTDAGLTYNAATGVLTAANLSGTNTGDQSLAAYATTASVAAGYQPLDADLTAVAALTTVAFGRSLLTQASAAATRTTLGLIDLPQPTETWLSTAGHFTDAAGTTACTTTGNNVRCWTGSNGTKLTNSLGSFDCTYRKDAIATGRHAVRTDSGLLASAALPASVDRRNSTIVVVYARRLSTTAPVLSLNTAASDFSTGQLHIQNGYQRPEALSFGAYTPSDYGTPLDGFNVIVLTSGPSNYRFCVNGNLGPDTAGTLSSGTFPAIGIGTLSGLLSGGDVARIDVYPSVMTAPQLQAVCADRMEEFGIAPPHRAVNLIFAGNSITSGASAAYTPFASSAAAAAGVSAYDYRNRGLSGATTAVLVTRDTTLAATLFDPSMPDGRNVVVAWELTNSLASNISAATTLASHASWVAIWRAAGFRVLCPTCLDRTSLFSGGQTSGGFATSQATVNAALLTNAGGIYGDRIIDLTSVASVGTAGDGTHPNQAGHDSIGALVGAGIATVLAALPVADGGTGLTAIGTALQVLRTNAGATALEFATLAGGGNAQTADPLSQFAATTSAQLAGVISDETGSGALVFATSPTLVTPALGTPSAVVLTNATGTAAGLTAGNATVAATVTVADTTDTTCFVALFEDATGNLAPKTDGSLLYDASTGVLATKGVSARVGGSFTSERFGVGAGAAVGSTVVGGTFVGGAAGAAVTTGTHNTLVGFQCADGLTTGGENVMIGSQINCTSNVGLSSSVIVSRSVVIQAGASRAVAIGISQTVGHADCVLFGAFAISTQANRAVLGRNQDGLTMQSLTTVQDRDCAEIQRGWATNTDASRAGYVDIGAYSVATYQPGIRVEANSGGVRLGFFAKAATPVAQPAAVADSTGVLLDLTTQFNTLLARLRSVGIIAT